MWLRGLPAAEEAAGDCFLGTHPEHVGARCSDLHAKFRVKVVELTAKRRSLSAIMMSWLECKRNLCGSDTKSGDVCLSCEAVAQIVR